MDPTLVPTTLNFKFKWYLSASNTNKNSKGASKLLKAAAMDKFKHIVISNKLTTEKYPS